MLDKINRYAHGLVAIPVILACKERGFFQILRDEGPQTLEQLVSRLRANPGHMRAALRLLQSMHWLTQNESGEYSCSSLAANHEKIPEDALQLLRFPFESCLAGDLPEGRLRHWIEHSRARWNTQDTLIADFLDGIFVIPLLLALREKKLLNGPQDGQQALFTQLSPNIRGELYELFQIMGWGREEGERFIFTDEGRYLADRILITASTASYFPMYRRLPDLLFGNPAGVFQRDAAGHETHIDRVLNVTASGFQHKKYFADAKEIILAIFDRLPFEEQPKYIADMGCGDGTFLKEAYETIRSESRRGTALDKHPLVMIGVDYNRKALEETGRTLSGIPHLTLHGDIGDPGKMAEDLTAKGIQDTGEILHIRSFLDHNRPFIPPARKAETNKRSLLPYSGVYVDSAGGLISPHIMAQSLAEHLERWAAVTTRHGIIMLEVHCLKPDVVSAFLDKSENLHFDAYHAFSMQHLVEADEWIMAAAEAGLFQKPGFSRRFPKTLPFTRITLDWFEKRPYRIRHPQPEDLADLLHLETVCWPENMRTSAAEIQRRIEKFPKEHCVLEMEGRIAGVIYSQRISSIEALQRISWAGVPSLYSRQGQIIQLLNLNVLPEIQDKGLGDQLLEFALNWRALQSNIGGFAGVTRCKNYAHHASIPFSEYISKLDSQGLPLDPILRFHFSHGASIRGAIANYRPEDTDNQGNGVLIEYDIYQRQGKRFGAANSGDSLQSLSLQIEECIRGLIGEKRMAAYAPKRPLMQIGLDSLDLMELKILLGQLFGVELDAAFFFQHSTPAAIARFLENARGIKDEERKESAGIKRRSAAISQNIKIENPDPEIKSRPADARGNGGYPDEPVAIIGMACRFPGARSIEEYWSILRNGADAISEVPASRWDINRYHDPDFEAPGKIVTRYGGFLENVDLFDARFFGISSREAAHTDPQQRILLEIAWEAIERAGINPETLAGSETGVFTGIFSHDYEILQVRQNHLDGNYNVYFGVGNSASTAAGRLSYVFDLKGPAITVNTACSSSLVSVHLACQSLRHGECGLAIASGVNLLLSPELSITFSKSGMLAKDGRCKTFDSSAEGYIRSEGCGVVILKRLSCALADNDNILAVIRGSAINQDGASNGLTAPNGFAQEAVIRKALASAGLSPGDIGFVEAHGTATSLGDPVEIKALQTVYGQDRTNNNPLVISSVKTNIGHSEAAAGIAGLIKIVLALQNEFIPKHLHFEKLNPHISLKNGPFEIPTEGLEWKRNSRKPRRAAVSSFGFSGTNAHAILEEPPPLVPVTGKTERPKHLLTLSAKCVNALNELANGYDRILQDGNDGDLKNICFAANTGRAHFNQRAAFVAASAEQARKQIRAFIRREKAAGLFAGEISGQSPPRIAFLFTGQGSQYIGMGSQLYETSPVFRETLDRCDEILRSYLQTPLLDIIYPAPSKTSPLDDTACTQPALFALEYSLAALWISWGIKPAMVMGHSVGEYVAACIAGVFSLEDGLRLIAERGRLMQALPQNGAMMAVLADETQTAAAIQPYLQKVAVAAFNGPSNTVISGDRQCVEAVAVSLEAEGIDVRPLNVSHAFHSHLMDPMLDDFMQVAETAAYTVPCIDLISNVSGQVAGENVASPEYWRNHIRQPVRFADSMRTALQRGCNVFLEVGPKPVLVSMGRLCLPDGAATWLSSLRQGQEDWPQLLCSLGELYVRGVNVDWNGFYHDYPCRRLPVPTYPFQRKRFWIDINQSIIENT